MSSSNVAISSITLFTGGHGHCPSHPMINPTFQQPFTLLPLGAGYQLTFFSRDVARSRVYAKGFSASSAETRWWSSAQVNQSVGETQYAHIQFSQADLNGSTHLWVGSWWDDGTYPATTEGIAAYFTDHPDSSEHHTVPILVGGG